MILNQGGWLKSSMGQNSPQFFLGLPVGRGPSVLWTLTNPLKTPGVTEGVSGPWICCVQGWVTGCGPEPARGVKTATVRAPGELGVTQPQRPCVCVWSAALLSPACTDATLFLFQIFAADFLFTRASVPASAVVFWCSCSFQSRLDRVSVATQETEALLL